nr:unnamed protein product [Callosobruchus analis]
MTSAGYQWGTCEHVFRSLREKVKLFLDHQNKKDLLQMFEDEKFHLSLAYLADIFEFLNNLNLKLKAQTLQYWQTMTMFKDF